MKTQINKFYISYIEEKVILGYGIILYNHLSSLQYKLLERETSKVLGGDDYYESYRELVDGATILNRMWAQTFDISYTETDIINYPTKIYIKLHEHKYLSERQIMYEILSMKVFNAPQLPFNEEIVDINQFKSANKSWKISKMVESELFPSTKKR